MSFNLSGSTTPSQPSIRPLYPSFNLQTPATPTPSKPFKPNGQQKTLKPPQRPASVPLSFGGLSHSASTPSLSQAFQSQAPQQQQQSQPQTQGFGGLGQQQQQQQPFSPAPQPPLTTYDLSNSPFQKPQQQPSWGGQLGGQTLTRSHSQQFMPLNQNPLGERRYLPSHLRVPVPSPLNARRNRKHVSNVFERQVLIVELLSRTIKSISEGYECTGARRSKSQGKEKS